MHAFADDEGITLVEVMITLLILLVVFAAFVATIIAGLRSLSESRARQFASQVATESIENLRAHPHSAIAMDSDTVDILAISTCTAAVDDDGDGTIDRTPPGFDPDGPGQIGCEEIAARTSGAITMDGPFAGTEDNVTFVTIGTFAQDDNIPSGPVRVTVESDYSLSGGAATIRRQALFSEVSRG